MTTPRIDEFHEWFAAREFSWQIRKYKRPLRDAIAEGYLLCRSRYRGDALVEKVTQHVEKEHPGAIPWWLVGPVLTKAVELFIRWVLEKWWNERNQEAMQGHA